MQDHRELESLFREFEYLHAKDEDAGHVVDAACAELKTHDRLKSELFCPAVFDAVDEPDIEDLLAQVEEGHQAIRELITRVEHADADHAKRDAQFRLLSARVEHQFELAETQVFPRARRLERLDLVSVADRMQAHKNDMAHQI
jgi:hypothetical protein